MPTSSNMIGHIYITELVYKQKLYVWYSCCCYELRVITSTSNNHPNHVIENIIQRVQIEGECEYKEQNKREESEIHKLSAALGRRKNTIFSTTFMDEQALQYQAHLERIGDFLCLVREYGGRVFLKGSNFWMGMMKMTLGMKDQT